MKLLREPLVHFVVLGALLFALDAMLGRSEPPPADSTLHLEVSLDAMTPRWADWEQQWGVAPSPEDRAEAVREFVREELLVREARRLGLAVDESAVRRKLAEKMEFLSRDEGLITDPTDAHLAAHLASYPERFASAARITFSHILFATDRRGAAAATDAGAELAKLRAMPSPPERAAELGDAFALRHDFLRSSKQEVELLFGLEFAGAVWDAPPGAWSGPVTSPYGSHLVRVAERVAGAAPALEQARDRVRADWIESQRAANFERFFEGLRAKYRVTYGDGVPVPAVK